MLRQAYLYWLCIKINYKTTFTDACLCRSLWIQLNLFPLDNGVLVGEWTDCQIFLGFRPFFISSKFQVSTQVLCEPNRYIRRNYVRYWLLLSKYVSLCVQAKFASQLFLSKLRMNGRNVDFLCIKCCLHKIWVCLNLNMNQVISSQLMLCPVFIVGNKAEVFPTIIICIQTAAK